MIGPKATEFVGPAGRVAMAASGTPLIAGLSSAEARARKLGIPFPLPGQPVPNRDLKVLVESVAHFVAPYEPGRVRMSIQGCKFLRKVLPRSLDRLVCGRHALSPINRSFQKLVAAAGPMA